MSQTVDQRLKASSRKPRFEPTALNIDMTFADAMTEAQAANPSPNDGVIRSLAKHVTRTENARRSVETLISIRGRRYADCTFESYRTTTEEQRNVVALLRKYAHQTIREVEAGRNLVLFGPKGTGKDHLLMALAKVFAISAGVQIHWVNGVDLLDQLRRDSLSFETRPQSANEFRNVDVLWISDPLPPSGPLCEVHQAALFGLIDARYSHMRPTWVSMNVASAAEAEERMGAQMVDRLRHGAVSCYCNWNSYRSEGR